MTKPKTWPWQALLVIGTWAATLLGTAWAVSADRAQLATQVEANAAKLADHEGRLRTVENTLITIATDVRWIRGALKPDHATEH